MDQLTWWSIPLRCCMIVQMPRYQVAITIGTEAYEDHDGVELDSPETACHEAQQVAWELWQDPPVGNEGPVTVSVLDSAGHLIHTVSFPDSHNTKH
jgi:hypothetical protein